MDPPAHVNVGGEQSSRKRFHDSMLLSGRAITLEPKRVRLKLLQVVQHQPLGEGEIRLVNFGVSPGQSALANVPLDGKPEYIAISYCWGAENCLHPFRINAQILILTSSLYTVFSELWDQGFRGKIWADAICINQDDDNEKSVQIPLMHNIYRNAVEVYAWLGSSSSGRPVPMAVIDKIIKSAETLREEMTSFEQAIEHLQLPRSSSIMWDDIANMMSSSWFDRLWTLQEAVIPDKLFVGYGHDIRAWETLFLLQRRLRDLYFEPFWKTRTGQENDFTGLLRINNINYCREEFHHGGISIMTIFEHARGKKVSRIQDRVYAIYGFMDVALQRVVPIDMAATPQRLFTCAAKAMFTFEPSLGLDLLANAETPSRLSGLPSWVPDLTSSAPEWMLARYCGYNAGLADTIQPAPLVSLTDEENRLAIAGFHLDTVADAQPTVHTSSRTGSPNVDKAAMWAKDFLEGIDLCIRMIKRFMTAQLSNNEIWFHLGRVLVCDRPRWTKQSHQRCGGEQTRHLRKVVAQMKRVAKGLSCNFGDSYVYSDTLSVFNIRRSFFITRAGRMGLGPGALDSGDHILILRGGETPFAARANSKLPAYQLLGECFVDGVMEGQAYETYYESGKKDDLLVFE